MTSGSHFFVWCKLAALMVVACFCVVGYAAPLRPNILPFLAVDLGSADTAFRGQPSAHEKDDE